MSKSDINPTSRLDEPDAIVKFKSAVPDSDSRVCYAEARTMNNLPTVYLLHGA